MISIVRVFLVLLLSISFYFLQFFILTGQKETSKFDLRKVPKVDFSCKQHLPFFELLEKSASKISLYEDNFNETL